MCRHEQVTLESTIRLTPLATPFFNNCFIFNCFCYCTIVINSRSLPNVILGGFGTSGTGTGKAKEITGTATVWDVKESVQAIADARNIVIVPG